MGLELFDIVMMLVAAVTGSIFGVWIAEEFFLEPKRMKLMYESEERVQRLIDRYNLIYEKSSQRDDNEPEINMRV